MSSSRDVSTAATENNQPRVSSQMDAVIRLMSGQESRTIADKMADSNRPTWEQYKKDNEDKLNLSGADQKKMEEYRKQLDQDREARLSKGRDRKKEKKDSASKTKRKSSKNRKKHKKKRRKSTESGDDNSSDRTNSSLCSDTDSIGDESFREKRRKKHHKKSSSKRKKKSNRKRDKDLSDEDRDADKYRLSSFFADTSDVDE